MDEDSTGDTSSVFSDQVSPQEQEMSGEIAGSPDTVGLDDIDLSKNMPWIPVSKMCCQGEGNGTSWMLPRFTESTIVAGKVYETRTNVVRGIACGA